MAMHCGAFYKLLSTTVASTPAERRVLYSRLAVRGAVAYVLTGAGVARRRDCSGACADADSRAGRGCSELAV